MPEFAIRTLITLLLGLALFAILVASVDDPRAALAALLGVGPLPLVLGLVAYVACYVCRAIRFRALLGADRAPLADTTAIVAVHNLLNMILPVRTGELSYVVLAQKRLGARLSEGAATLVLARIYDLVGIAAFFLAALALRGERAAGAPDTYRFAIAAAILLALSVVALAALGPILEFARRRLPSPRDAGARPRLEKLGRMVDALAIAVRESRARGEFVRLFVVTELQWFFTFVTCFAVLRACPGAESFPFLPSIIGSTGLSLALILPINPVGNVGTFQAGWIAGYALAGLDRQVATASAIVAHAAILLYAAILAAAGHAWLRATEPRSTPARPAG